MIKASGCCFLALDTGRIMLQQRSKKTSHPLTWSFWGGKSHKRERPIETLLRECKEELGIDFYFTHPYSSWEKGTNENTNGLIRQYFPKGTDFSKITESMLAEVEAALNARPRKCLNYKTPNQVLGIRLN